MSWRKAMNHSEETKAVRDALKAAGINARVGHSRGTGWAWMKVNLGEGQQWGEHLGGTTQRYRCTSDCPRCLNLKAMTEVAKRIVNEVTGRHGRYDGEVNYMHQDAWSDKKGSTPIEHPNWVDVTTLPEAEVDLMIYGSPEDLAPEPDPELEPEAARLPCDACPATSCHEPCSEPALAIPTIAQDPAVVVLTATSQVM